MLTPAEIESASMLFDGMMKRLEESVMQDIVRRIRINGEITRSADWQLNRLYELGESRRELSRLIKDGLQIDDEKLTDMFRDIICSGYARDDKLYKMTGKLRLPFAENAGLQQYISAVAQQTGSTMKNLSQSMGFSVNVGGRVQFQPIAAYYQDTLDNAVNGIATGAFDYNTILKRTVKEMTDSGLRTVDYASGHVDRVDVAARRAVMTGLTQITAKVNDDNAKALETDTFEISWHSGARPSHQVWQGRWYTEKELTTVCGLGSVTGLCGANCYHSYYPVIPGVSVPNYTEEELDEMNRRENEPVEYNGREYTKYEATQRQRYLERKMRAQRQEIKLLQDGGADENDLIAARCRYRQTSQTYTDFSKAMELPQQRQRVTIDGLGNIGQGKWKNPSKPVAKSGGSGIIKSRDIASRNLPNGLRTASSHILTEAEIQSLKEDIASIEADESVFKFNKGRRTGYDDVLDEIRVKGDILPDLNSNHPRDRMSSRAALAHEYYGHRANRGTNVPNGAWNDEFRASYMAAKNCPNLTDEERRDLVLDALERARESGVTIKNNDFIRRILYGY